MSEELAVREASPDDARLVFTWRNDPRTRAASFDQEAIAWPQHEQWFTQTLARADRHLLMLEADQAPVGVIRFDATTADTWEVSINLAPEARGRGLGAAALRRAVAWLGHNERPTEVIAEVKPDNEASTRVFVAAGFVLLERRSDRLVYRLGVPGTGPDHVAHPVSPAP